MAGCLLWLTYGYAQTDSTKTAKQANAATIDLTTPYAKGMLTAIKIMDKARDVGQLQQAANFFMDMADTHPTDWLPPYYAAYCYTLMGFMEKQRLLRDKYLDDAQIALDLAQKASPNNDEILVVQAYIYQTRLQINANERMEEYGTMANVTLENAEKINPDNPRVYYIRAQNMFFAPEASRTQACESVSMAQAKYATFEPENALMPKWGAAMTDFMSFKCQELYQPATTTQPEDKATQPPATTLPSEKK